jgi:hypothetical protein
VSRFELSELGLSVVGLNLRGKSNPWLLPVALASIPTWTSVALERHVHREGFLLFACVAI